jgi:class 3 adenylate cyclase
VNGLDHVSNTGVERRLAAILAADVANYSRLMGTDEEGTLAALKHFRSEVIDPRIAEHKGRIVKTIGDGVLIEFPSVLEAMRCTVAVQREMAARNAAGNNGDILHFGADGKSGGAISSAIFEGDPPVSSWTRGRAGGRCVGPTARCQTASLD